MKGRLKNKKLLVRKRFYQAIRPLRTDGKSKKRAGRHEVLLCDFFNYYRRKKRHLSGKNV
ncbi:hypothetical protein CBF27_11885 [Vagococcus acidifermentans]|uniref:Uncharacterized protein n=1 Tax=Vagococcus acidifermentans TaxID=564710 RepID=A0A430ANR6_9ENTE|nr:hypothetical protein CBF27_11885 [Vagococcus acidifermentans]